MTVSLPLSLIFFKFLVSWSSVQAFLLERVKKGLRTCATPNLNYFILRFQIIALMSERKPWTKEEDALLRRLVAGNDQQQEKLRWADIAAQLESELGRSGEAGRSGKQCRERWHNQLKPGIDNEREWTAEEQQVLFRVQEEQGNRWAQIARHLPGRTDNNIKNYFYSTLRKALRKVNSYVQMHKRETHYRNIKEFKQHTLSKILSVAEKKYENKINLKNEGVEHDAQQIKRKLVEIQRDDSIVPSHLRNRDLEETVELILEFNRNCKRRKGRRRGEEEEEEESEEPVVETPPRPAPKPKRIKKPQPEEPKKQPAVLTRKQSSNLNSSQNVSEGALKRLSSSSHIKDGSSQLYGSSSFRNYQAGSGSNSQNYNAPLFESRYLMGNEAEQQQHLPFLSSIRQLERRDTIKSGPLDLWQEENDINLVSVINNAPFNLDWSQNFTNGPDGDLLRMSHNLEGSCLLTHKPSSRMERRSSDKK